MRSATGQHHCSVIIELNMKSLLIRSVCTLLQVNTTIVLLLCLNMKCCWDQVDDCGCDSVNM